MSASPSGSTPVAPAPPADPDASSATGDASRLDLWVGTYPADGAGGSAGTGEGIWRVALDTATGALTGSLVARSPAPSFLAASADGGWVYAVGENGSGTVSAFAVTPGGLEPRGTVASGGSAPCHLLLHPSGRTLYVTNYTSGTVGVLTLAADGGFSAEVLAAGGPLQTFEHPGPRTVGVVPDRQDGPHAHSSLLAPGGEHLLVADLGTDELRRFTVGVEGLLQEAGVAAVLPAGSGPRHLAAGPDDHLYVVGELGVDVHVLAWDRSAGSAHRVQGLPAHGGAAAAQGTAADGSVLPAHVVLAGSELLVSVRGVDVLSRFDVGDDGRLEHTGDVPLGGSWPRHFAVLGDAPAGRWVVVAAEESGRLLSLRLGADGVEHAGELQVPYPACVVPVTTAPTVPAVTSG